MNTRKFDLAVVGAGLVGVSFALAMRGAGLRTALLGPIANPPPGTRDDWDTRVYAISPDSAAFLASLGVWPLVDPSRFLPCLGMDVSGDALGGRIAFSAFEAGVPALAYITESRAIARPMAQLLQDSDVVLVRQAFAGAFQDGTGAWRVQLADGEALDAGLLIGADGGESEVRKAAGLAARVFDYRQHAVVANYRVERAHGGIAFQWFRHPDVLAYLPLPDNCMSMVWSLPAEQALVFAEIPPAQLAERAGAAGHHRLGQLSPLGAQAAFPLQTTRVPAIVGNRVALIGDAAHTVHPLAGLGVNLGFRDARVLAATLRSREAFRGYADARVLARYARARSEDILAVQTFTHAMQRLFAASWPAAATIRNLGLNLVDRLPVVKGQLMRRALAS